MRLNIHEMKQAAQLVLDWYSYQEVTIQTAVRKDLYVRCVVAFLLFWCKHNIMYHEV